MYVLIAIFVSRRDVFVPTQDIVMKLPLSKKELSSVSGLGENKVSDMSANLTLSVFVVRSKIPLCNNAVVQ